MLHAVGAVGFRIAHRVDDGVAAVVHGFDCRTTKGGAKLCTFVDETGALRSADCKAIKRLVYCEVELPPCP